MSSEKKKKLAPIKRDGKLVGYVFFCPGCDFIHRFNIDPDNGKPTWDFDGDMDNPTFSPSLGLSYPDEEGFHCHLFLKKGKIRYLSDCKHDLAGKTIDLPPLPESWQD